MAKKTVYAKGFNGVSDFVYVDLLPDVKRSRQFNMNVIIALTFAVVLSFVLIYMPFRAVTEDFEKLNGKNNDLKHQLLLTNEELQGYEIDLSTIAFKNDIETLSEYKINLNFLTDDIKILIELRNTYFMTLSNIKYNATLNSFEIVVISTQESGFVLLNNDFKNLPWVSYSIIASKETLQDNTWETVIMIGVDEDAE